MSVSPAVERTPAGSDLIRHTVVIFSGWFAAEGYKIEASRLDEQEKNSAAELLVAVRKLTFPGQTIKAIGFHGAMGALESHICRYPSLVAPQPGNPETTLYQAWSLIEENFDPRGTLILYGYSAGGHTVLVLCRAISTCKANYEPGVGFPHWDRPLSKTAPRTIVDLLVTCDAATGPTSRLMDRRVAKCVRNNLNMYQTRAIREEEFSCGAPNRATDEETRIENQDWTDRQWIKPDGVEETKRTHYNLGNVTNAASLAAITSCIASVLPRAGFGEVRRRGG